MRHKIKRIIDEEHTPRWLVSLGRAVSRLVRQTTDMAMQSMILAGAAATALATVGFVAYKDYRRDRRMIERFSQGCIVEPLGDSRHQIRYYDRWADQARLRDILKCEISNQYYLVYGEVGTGKTRLITRVVQSLINESGKKRMGAPVYVLAAQGHSFPDSFAEAINFHFDEHLSFRFVVDFIIRVGEMPKRDDNSKLDRVLFAIEKSAYQYLERTGKPAVIVVDGVDFLTGAMPGALERIQEKAKLWADTNIAKLILVSNDEKTEEVLESNQSAWARAAMQVQIGDLQLEQARSFLALSDPVIDHIGKIHDVPTEKRVMPDKHLDRILALVGGRLQHLLICKLEWAEGKSFELTAAHLKMKERAKFYEVSQVPSQRKVIEVLWKAHDREMTINKLTAKCDRDDVQRLSWDNIIRIEICPKRGLVVKFQSRLTEVVAQEMIDIWQNTSGYS